MYRGPYKKAGKVHPCRPSREASMEYAIQSSE